MINSTTFTAADLAIGLAGKLNHYLHASAVIADRKCSNCVRRQFSYPDTCKDGWPAGSSSWKDLGSQCGNWTNGPMEPAARVSAETTE